MTEASPPTRVIFLHIPKTGGGTLRTILVRNATPRSVHLQRIQTPRATPQPDRRRLGRAEVERRELEHYADEDLARLRVVAGHYLYGIHEVLPGPSAYVTLLRDPVDRVLSLYQYRRTIQGLRASIDEYVARDPDPELDDGQTVAIAGAVPPRPRDPDVMSRVLERGKQNLLRTFAVVGLTERFDESLALLGRAFGWRRLAYVQRNVGARRPVREELAPETVDRILDRNRCDDALYVFARELFERRLAETDPPIDGDVRRLRRRNRLHRRVPLALRAADRLARVRVEAGRTGATRRPGTR